MAAGSTVRFDVDRMEEGQSGGESLLNEALNSFDVLIQLAVERDDLVTAPVGVNGNAYLIAGTGAGDWVGYDDLLAYYSDGWYYATPIEGMRYYNKATNQFKVYNGTSWVNPPLSVEDGITASTTQTQGQEQMSAQVNRIAVCANANDVVTLPSCSAGAQCTIFNDGAQTLQIFPNTDDEIRSLAADASTTLAAGSSVTYYGISLINW